MFRACLSVYIPPYDDLMSQIICHNPHIHILLSLCFFMMAIIGISNKRVNKHLGLIMPIFALFTLIINCAKLKELLHNL